jgi:hypothetical protein
MGGESSGPGGNPADRIRILTPGDTYTDPPIETMTFINGRVGVRTITPDQSGYGATFDINGSLEVRGGIRGGDNDNNDNFYLDSAGGDMHLNWNVNGTGEGIVVGNNSGRTKLRLVGDSLDSTADPSQSAYAQLEITSSSDVVGGSNKPGNLQIGFDHRPGSVGCGFLQGIVDGEPAKPAIALNPAGGNVGIGTTTPSANLHVMGNVYATGNVETAGFLGRWNSGQPLGKYRNPGV